MSDRPHAVSILIEAQHGDEALTHGKLQVCIDALIKLERENAALRLAAEYYALGGPTDGGSYARIKLAEVAPR